MTILVIALPSTMMCTELAREKKWKKFGLVLLWGIPMTAIGITATISVLLKMIYGA